MGLIETRGLFNLEKTMVLVLHKELELDCGQSLIFEVPSNLHNFNFSPKTLKVMRAARIKNKSTW